MWFSTIAQKLRKPFNFELQGNVIGNFEGKKVYLYYLKNSIATLDSSTISNSKFFFYGKILNPSLATISNNMECEFDDFNTADIYLSFGKMKIDFALGQNNRRETRRILLIYFLRSHHKAFPALRC